MRVDARLLSVIGIVLLVGGGLLLTTLVLPVQADTSGDWTYTRPPAANDTTRTNVTVTGTAGAWFSLQYELSLDFLDSAREVIYTQPFALFSNFDDATFDMMQVSVAWSSTGENMDWSTFDLDVSVCLDINNETFTLRELSDQSITGAIEVDVREDSTLEPLLEQMYHEGFALDLEVAVEFDFEITDVDGLILTDVQTASLPFTISYSPVSGASVIALPSLMGMSATTGGFNPMTNAAMWPILLGGLLLFYFYVLPIYKRRPG